MQEFLAVAVGGGLRGPQRGQVSGDGEDLGSLVGAEPDGPGGFAAVQVGSGILGGLQRGFPFGFQAAGDQPVLRVDSAVAALGPGGGVAGLLGLAAPLIQRGIVAASIWSAASIAACSASGVRTSRTCWATAGSVRRPLTLVQNRPCPPPTSTPPLHW